MSRRRPLKIKKKTVYRYLIIIAAYFIGLLAGGYAGLVIGGTFFGGLNLYEKIGIKAYELFTYFGAILGLVLISPKLYKLFSKKFEL